MKLNIFMCVNSLDELLVNETLPCDEAFLCLNRMGEFLVKYMRFYHHDNKGSAYFFTQASTSSCVAPLSNLPSCQFTSG